MQKPLVTILKTGIANTASVSAAFQRLGAQVELTDSASVIDNAELLVFPGVGTFGAGMESLRSIGVVEMLAQRIASRAPTLAICLGLQLLCQESEESPGVSGIGSLDQTPSLFPSNVQSPQFGWNKVVAPDNAVMLRSGYAYFANSYRIAQAPSGWLTATSDHGGSFIAAIESGPVLACQFHPELSGAWGSQLLSAWMTKSREAVPC
ncbi:MAG: imidazole glycerol phosphate synthase subunit HisH [Phycisphaerales bacterium]